MLQKGLFISIDGLDGAGKTSHLVSLSESFKSQGRVVTNTREPGGTPLAEKLRSMVLNDSMDAMTEALLVFAARRDHLLQCIEPALARGEVVVCDRFTDATFAYQGAGRGFDLNILAVMEQWVQTVKDENRTFVRQPDVTVWFDLPAQVAAARLADARIPDKFEAQNLDFFKRVSDGYLARMTASPERFMRINADQSREAVWNDILSGFRDRGLL